MADPAGSSSSSAAPAAAQDAPVQETPTKKPLQLILKSSDGLVMTVDEDVAFQSCLLKKMVDDLQIEDADSPLLKEPLPVSNVDGWTLHKLVEWCTKHRRETYKPKEEHEDPRIDLTREDEEFMDVTSEQLLAMLLGANYLDIPGIVDVITQKIANMANGKTVEELRETFCLQNDFTPEEEEEIRKRFEWVEA